MNKLITMIILAASPISECRGSIPFGIAVGINPFLVFLLSIIFNIAIIPIIFILLKISRIRELIYKILGNKIEKTVEKWNKKFGRFEELGLMLFVAIPLPVTGAYTGSLIAYFLGLDLKKSIIWLSVGVIIAATIILLITSGLINLFKW